MKTKKLKPKIVTADKLNKLFHEDNIGEGNEIDETPPRINLEMISNIR
jgi:hypothetical protein